MAAETFTRSELDTIARVLESRAMTHAGHGYDTAAHQLDVLASKAARMRRALDEQEAEEREARQLAHYSDERLNAELLREDIRPGRAAAIRDLMTVPAEARPSVESDARYAVNMGAASRHSDGVHYGVLAYRRAVERFGTTRVVYRGKGEWSMADHQEWVLAGEPGPEPYVETQPNAPV